MKKLQQQLGQPGGTARSLDKSGTVIQAEALQVALLMHGLMGRGKPSVKPQAIKAKAKKAATTA